MISIIDDDALARDGIQELVESLGYKAVSFSSAEHFLASGAIAKTTCLITDLQMPGLSGLELQEALRSQGHRTPVILITAYPNERRRNRAIDGGAVGFLSKPFDEASLRLPRANPSAIGPTASLPWPRSAWPRPA